MCLYGSAWVCDKNVSGFVFRQYIQMQCWLLGSIIVGSVGTSEAQMAKSCGFGWTFLKLNFFKEISVNWHLVPVAKTTLPSALSLRVNDLDSKLFGVCYDSGIVSLSLCLSPSLDMVLLEFPFTSCIEKCGQVSLSMFYRCWRFRL